MVEILEDRLKRGDFALDPATEFTIHKGDILAFIPQQESIIIANIPYYITSPILFRFLYEVKHTPSEMVILMQKEVGDKIRETKEFGRSYFSLACKRKCESIEECFQVSAGNFFPPPKVESAVLHFSGIQKKRLYEENMLEDRYNSRIQDSVFLSGISKGFAHPRKFLVSNLSSGDAQLKRQLTQLFLEL